MIRARVGLDDGDDDDDDDNDDDGDDDDDYGDDDGDDDCDKCLVWSQQAGDDDKYMMVITMQWPSLDRQDSFQKDEDDNIIKLQLMLFLVWLWW